VVGPAEGDDLLHSRGFGRPVTPEALWFWAEFVGSKEAGMSMQDMEGYDEVVENFLATLSPNQHVVQSEPLRPDYLLLRKIADKALDQGARTLRRLWPLLPHVSVVDYKSPGRPYRPGDLDRLWGYVHTHFANERSKPRARGRYGARAGDGRRARRVDAP
jgi:hypothetical protein